MSAIADTDNLNPFLRLENLTKGFREGKAERLVLENVDAQFYEGEITAITGQSGSGKSTLLNLISGIDNVEHGSIWLNDVELTALSENERTHLRRTSLGFIFQFFNLISTLTIWENVILPIELKFGSDNKKLEQAKMLLDRVGLFDRRDAYPDVLSGGEQQRIALVRSLVHDPLLILADEPTGNLDEKTSQAVLELLEELSRKSGKSVLMVTHSREVASMADRVFRLSNQQLIEL